MRYLLFTLLTGCSGLYNADETMLRLDIRVEPSELGGCTVYILGDDTKDRGRREVEVHKGL